MILCLDCGNSRLKWGLLSGDGVWQARGALELADIEQLGGMLRGMPIARALGCNVAGPDAAARIAAQSPAVVEWAQPASEQCGVKNGYRDIRRLGLDRWVALIAARGLHPGNCLVVSAGTATTVDILTADGAFRGGLILPGVDLMRRSLARSTAQLPLAQAGHVEIPIDTDAAIVSGALEATAGAIERMYLRMTGLDSSAEALCLLGGGAAEALAPLLRIRVQSVDDLVLRGLARISLNSSPTS